MKFASFFVPSMKVRTKAPTSWALKTRKTKSSEQKRNVTDVALKTSKGSPLHIYNVDMTKFPKNLRKINPWGYLKSSRDEKLDTATQSALQSVFHTASVIREQRMMATKSMAQGSVVWRKILWAMRHQVNIIRSMRRWYTIPFYYLKYKYLRYCITEINLTQDRIFCQFGFSYADLRKDSDLLKPKASYLKSFRTKELLFGQDSLSMTEELRLSQRDFALTQSLRLKSCAKT
jgi:hypothetical protein